MLDAFLVGLATADETSGEGSLLLPAFYDILWSAVIFVVVLVFFMWRVLPRLNAVLDARAEAIEGNIEKAQAAEAKAQAALEEYEAQLAEARGEAARIKDQARQDAAKIEQQLKAKAHDEAERITAQAHQRIEADRQSAMVALKGEVGTLAIDLSERVVGQSLDEGRSRQLVDQFLADLESESQASR